MIRINLLGQRPPKPTRAGVPAAAGMTLLLLVASLALAGVVLFVVWRNYDAQLQEKQKELQTLNQEKAQLEELRRQVMQFETERAIRQQRIDVIKALDRNRTGGQELMESLAGTVVRTDGLWLTGMTRKGNGLELAGMSGSIKAVANFITQLKRSGYFDKVEIKEAKQDDRNTAVTVFLFTLTADFALPQAQSAGGAPRS